MSTDELKNQASLFPDILEAIEATGDEDFIDASRLGRYAEFIVCAEITRLSYHAIHVDAPGFDVILCINGSSLRVQVKSTARIKRPPIRRTGTQGPSPRFSELAIWSCHKHTNASNGGSKDRGIQPITKADADMIALYHHTLKTTVFMPISAVGNGKIALPIAQLKDPDVTARSLESTLRQLVRPFGGVPV